MSTIIKEGNLSDNLDKKMIALKFRQTRYITKKWIYHGQTIER